MIYTSDASCILFSLGRGHTRGRMFCHARPSRWIFGNAPNLDMYLVRPAFRHGPTGTYADRTRSPRTAHRTAVGPKNISVNAALIMFFLPIRTQHETYLLKYLLMSTHGYLRVKDMLRQATTEHKCLEKTIATDDAHGSGLHPLTRY